MKSPAHSKSGGLEIVAWLGCRAVIGARRAECGAESRRQLIILNASNESDFEGVFATMAQQKADALLLRANPYFFSRRAKLIALATQYRLPAIYEWREFALDGGLMSYGTVLTDAYSQAGNYAGRILKGEKPSDLPVVQPTKYQFVINLKTARSLGLEILPTLAARADQVIE
jgi:putative ABC transport system substrate-binding protein